jgi:hypothetical protein
MKNLFTFITVQSILWRNPFSENEIYVIDIIRNNWKNGHAREWVRERLFMSLVMPFYPFDVKSK